MTRQEIQSKLEYIVTAHDTIARSIGYSAATDVKSAHFHDLVRMIRTLLENDNGERQTNLGQVRDQGTSESGDQE